MSSDTKDSFVTNRDSVTNSECNFVVQVGQTETRGSREAVSTLFGQHWGNC